MYCKICGLPIVLIPSAIERVKKHGETAKFYTDLFETHPKCFTEKSKQESIDLIRRGKERCQ